MKTIKVICEYCGKEIEKPIGEVRRQRKNRGNDVNFFCDYKCSSKYGNKKYGKRVDDIERICPQCESIFVIKSGKDLSICCSSNCANKYFMTIDRKTKMSNAQTSEMKNNQSILSKKLQGNPEYQEKMAKHFKGHTHFTSKNEMFIRDYIIDNFRDDNQTFGGALKYDDCILVRDLYSDKLRICFEYDGDQHFKDIHGQLADKQKKDKALEAQCIENKYRLIRIDENIFKTDKSYQLNQLICEFYYGDEPIVKFGLRYI